MFKGECLQAFTASVAQEMKGRCDGVKEASTGFGD